ncbi:hypothetical protein FRC08_005383 [Ceratobasidium sp. 394]|nr:hypothetical protein FRC08_005383 [Ceratobasidium sp. 394]
MPFIDSIPVSSQGLQKKVIPILFPSGWDGLNGPVFDWYRGLTCRHINRLQIRKDSSGTVPHRFIVAHLTDHSIQRFDRRPKSKNSGEILVAGFLNTATIEAVDEIEMVEASTWPSLERQTACEVDLYLEGNMNILAILSACYGISRDNNAQNYALLRYNCYFFSWTILAVVARHKIPDSIPQADQVFDRLEPRLSSLTVTLAGELSHIVIQATLDTVTAFRHEVGYMTILRGIKEWGSSKFIWSMPTSILRFGLRNLLAFGLHPHLKPHIQKQLFSELAPKLRSMLECKLHAQLIPANIHDSLWLSEVQHIVEQAIRTEVVNTLDAVLWDTVGGAGADINVFDVAREVSQDSIAEGRGGGQAQFRALWNAAMYAALPALHQSAYGRIPDDTLRREDIFDEAWNAGRDAALEAAQAVIQDTGPQLNNPKRDLMWEKVWEVWDRAWGAAQGKARDAAVSSSKTMADSLINSIVEAVVLELGGSHLRLAPVRVNMGVSLAVACSDIAFLMK